MTTWAKTADKATTYSEVADGTEGASYDKVEGLYGEWSDLDFVLYLCTEGERHFIMAEGEQTYLIVKRGIDIANYSEVEDKTTTYIKVIDA